ncbi:unnamed protein product [Effrenium voratum]|nr:unnamed protein product [Effrenium voratum]
MLVAWMKALAYWEVPSTVQKIPMRRGTPNVINQGVDVGEDATWLTASTSSSIPGITLLRFSKRIARTQLHHVWPSNLSYSRRNEGLDQMLSKRGIWVEAASRSANRTVYCLSCYASQL